MLRDSRCIDLTIRGRFTEFQIKTLQIRQHRSHLNHLEQASHRQWVMIILFKDFREEKIAKKSHFKLNKWNTLSLQYTKEQGIVVKVNDEFRVRLSKVKESIEGLIKGQIKFGGHTEEIQRGNNKDIQKSKNLFHGLMKGIKMKIDTQQDPKVEEVKKSSEHEENEYIIEKFQFIHSLYELAKFDPKQHALHRSTVPLVQRPPRDRKILICHDIPSGLCEEKLSQGLYTTDQEKFNHWQYIDIFIYFGHYTVTIPPPGWINIAHQHGVKMLGTLIFEWDAGAKEAKLMLDGKQVLHPDIIKKKNDDDSDEESKEFVFKVVKDAPEGNRFYAKKLAEIAKHYGFDGYLMNFECEIDDTEVLLNWLSVLREELHKTVPGSLVIWYDSVLHEGNLRWQSALNDKNYKFFQVTDGFFTDYHWQLGYLNDTLEAYNKFIKEQNPNLSSYDIYYGNDTYGRGTYGGGRHNIFEAIKEINKYPFSIALFGQALWYEQYDGFQDLNIFGINEDIFWRGRNLHLLADSTGLTYNNVPASKQKTLNDWHMEEGEGKWKIIESKSSTLQYSSIASYKMCTKKLAIKVRKLIDAKIISSSKDIESLIFVTNVKGTPPDHQDAFKCFITLEDNQGHEIMSLKYNAAEELSVCKQDGTSTPILLQMKFSNQQAEEILPKLHLIKVTEVGKDAEYWAGHYGSEFYGERFYIEVGKKQQNAEAITQEDSLIQAKNLHHQFKNRGFAFEQVCTYFNIGFGQTYYINGVKVGNAWSNIQEYDATLLLQALTSQQFESKKGSFFTASITTDGVHYNGASSLQIKGAFANPDDEVIIKLQDITLLNHQSTTMYDVKMALKTDYRGFNSNLSLVFNYQDETFESFDVLNPELLNLLYMDNTWAIYDTKFVELPKAPTSLSLKLSSSKQSSIDIKIGLLSIAPAKLYCNGEIQIKCFCKVQQSKVESVIGGIRTRDVDLQWEVIGGQEGYVQRFRIWRDGTFRGVVKVPRYYDKIQGEAKGQYKIEAINVKNEIVAICEHQL